MHKNGRFQQGQIGPTQSNFWPAQMLEKKNNDLLLIEHEGRSGEYWHKVVTVRTKRSEVRAKSTVGQ